jgi:hypothetical protein
MVSISRTMRREGTRVFVRNLAARLGTVEVVIVMLAGFTEDGL